MTTPDGGPRSPLDPGPESPLGPPRPAKPSYRAVAIALGSVVLLAGAGVAALALTARRQIRDVLLHVQAMTRAEAAPGTAVDDPTLPDGVVEVTLGPAWSGLEPARPATVHLGGAAQDWTTWPVGVPLRFERVALARDHTLSIGGPYVAEAVPFGMPSAGGVEIVARVIPIDPPAPIEVPVQTPEKVLDVDLTRPEGITLRWCQGAAVVSLAELPRSPEVLAPAALTARFESEWKMQRGHFDPEDRKVDHAIVRVAPESSFAEVFPVAQALLATERPMGSASVPVFAVSVQTALPPRPPHLARTDDAARPWKGPRPKVRPGALQVSGRLPPAVIQGVLATREDEVRLCYMDALRRTPRVEGRVSIRLVIGSDGAASNLGNGGSDLPDAAAVACVVAALDGLEFPRPAGGIVTVTAPYLLFPPGR